MTHVIELLATVDPWPMRSSLLGVLVLVLDLVAIISVLLGRGSVTHKLFWTVIVLLLPVLGMVLYFIFGRSAADA